MKGKNPIRKWYLKTWAVRGYYQYDIYQVHAGDLMWLEATPITPGTVTRTADTETELRILLENDCMNIVKNQQRRREK